MEGKVMVRIQGRKMTLCKHYLHGNCKNGSNCNYLHDPCRKNKSLCKPFVRGYCSRVGSMKDNFSRSVFIVMNRELSVRNYTVRAIDYSG